jgi:hypothetical protein
LSMVAYAATPSLRDRTLAAVPVWYRTVTTGVSGADGAEERELVTA